MRKFQVLMVAALLVGGLAAATTAVAGYGRCYYSSWSYYPSHNYYYSNCYYQPYVNSDYSYHYCVYVPSQPRYCYYYNPSSQSYWGRYDLEAKGYSMLEEKDRKKNLKEIPEEAFPKPAEMPTIPGAKDDLKLEVPPAPPTVAKAGK